DIAHAIGKADAHQFHTRMGVVDPIERLSAGPVHFAYSGWAFVKIHPESRPAPDENYYLIYDHPFSFESDAWVRRGRKVDFPVCIMNAGYSSGWCEESFGLPLVAAEVECIARGDAACRFIMAPPARIEEHVRQYLDAHKPGRSGASTLAAVADRTIEVPEFFQRKRLEEELHASHAMLEERVRERTAELEDAVAALRREMAERLRAEEERRRLEQQLLHAQKLESLGVLAGGIAHDFNNLLVGVLGNASLALEELPEDSAVRETIKDVEVAALRAAELTRQMLAYAGRSVFEVQLIDLPRLVREMTHLLRAVISKKATLHFEFPADLPAVNGDPTQLRQVVMNLITNASDALGAGGGRILISAHLLEADRDYLATSYLDDQLPAGKYVALSVTDTGRGMDAETRDRMFDPFFSTKFVGRGLGLAAVLGITRAHHGTIHVESEPGVGTTITLLLPSSGRSPGQAVAEPPAEVPPGPGAPRGARGKVLVVDDERAVLSVAERILTRAGFEVATAGSAREALARVAGDEAYAVVLLDVSLPELTGEELLRQIRDLRPGIPVVLSSGHSESEIRRRFADLGVDAVVPKPFLPDELVAQLKTVAARRRKP
ncbi:MAG: response regulator, partial [Gemmatimonadales bacterium]